MTLKYGLAQSVQRRTPHAPSLSDATHQVLRPTTTMYRSRTHHIPTPLHSSFPCPKQTFQEIWCLWHTVKSSEPRPLHPTPYLQPPCSIKLASPFSCNYYRFSLPVTPVTDKLHLPRSDCARAPIIPHLLNRHVALLYPVISSATSLNYATTSGPSPTTLKISKTLNRSQ